MIDLRALAERLTENHKRLICATAGGAAVLLWQAAHPSEPATDGSGYWSLFLNAEGDDFRMEYDLTLEECLSSLYEGQERDQARDGNKRPWHCQRQPEGFKL